MDFLHNPVSLFIIELTMLAVIVQAVLSALNGTLRPSSKQKPDIAFLQHGGMWADFLIYPLINAAIWPYLEFDLWAILWGPLAISATVAMHALWGNDQQTSGHMWPAHPHNEWYQNISLAGWVHVLFMTAEIFLLLNFVTSPTPNSVVLLVGLLLTIAWPLGVIQPCYIITDKWLDKTALLTSIVMIGSTWLVCICKIAL